MNNIVNLPTLINKIAAETGVELSIVRRFIHDLFATVEERLSVNESIEIEGIGEFRRGDSVENPVLFRPSQKLSDIINEPFAAFSPVEINDGAEDELIKHPDTDIESSVSEQHEENKVQAQIDSAVEIPAENPEKHGDDRKPNENFPVNINNTEVEPETEPETETNALTTADQSAENELPQPQIIYTNSGSNALMLVLGILIGIIIGLVGGYFAGKSMAQFEMPYDEEDADDIEMVEIPASELSANDSIANVLTDSISATSIPQAAEKHEESASAPAEPVYDTVTQTRYLSIIARDHYGSKNYWVFIFKANPQLTNPNRIAPGTKVLIPPYESFAESSREATDAKAQKLLNELNGK